MRLALCLLAAGAALGLLACGGGDSASSTGQTTPTHPAQAGGKSSPSASGGSSATSSTGGSPSGGAQPNPDSTGNPERHRDRIPSVFVEAARVCAVGPPAKVAQNLRIKSTDPRAIATALAKGYKPRFRRSAYRGCLTALK
jgi:hypothetical protein